MANMQQCQHTFGSGSDSVNSILELLLKLLTQSSLKYMYENRKTLTVMERLFEISIFAISKNIFLMKNRCYLIGFMMNHIQLGRFGMAPSLSVNFISLVTSRVGLREEEPQKAHPMSFTWASLIAASVLTGH